MGEVSEALGNRRSFAADHGIKEALNRSMCDARLVMAGKDAQRGMGDAGRLSTGRGGVDSYSDLPRKRSGGRRKGTVGITPRDANLLVGVGDAMAETTFKLTTK
jgi:hypothetical protein